MKALYPSIDTGMALNDVLSRDDVRGVVMPPPPKRISTLAREVLLAGKHVYVEKPLVLQETEAYELINLPRKRVSR